MLGNLDLGLWITPRRAGEGWLSPLDHDTNNIFICSSHGKLADCPLCGDILVMPRSCFGKVVPQSLCTWLANMELSADRAYRGNSIGGKLVGEHLSCLFL